LQSGIITRSEQAFGAGRMFSFLGESGPSLFDSLFPRSRVWHRAVAAAFFVLLTAGLAQARFYLPDNPVPITFQTFGVLLTGGVLGWRWGLTSAVVYFLVGMAGLPVFQGGHSGWTYVVQGATGGYLIGFILATGVVGYLSQRGWNRGRSLWPMLVSALLVYVPGLLWLVVFDFGWPKEGQLFSAGMYPFIPGDIVKLMLAAVATGLLWRVVDYRENGRNTGR
jgi:biotin transport system substrate-specific component